MNSIKTRPYIVNILKVLFSTQTVNLRVLSNNINLNRFAIDFKLLKHYFPLKSWHIYYSKKKRISLKNLSVSPLEIQNIT